MSCNLPFKQIHTNADFKLHQCNSNQRGYTYTTEYYLVQLGLAEYFLTEQPHPSLSTHIALPHRRRRPRSDRGLLRRRRPDRGRAQDPLSPEARAPRRAGGARGRGGLRRPQRVRDGVRPALAPAQRQRGRHGARLPVPPGDVSILKRVAKAGIKNER